MINNLKEEYKLAPFLIKSKKVMYIDDSGISISKDDNLYTVECTDGLEDEEKTKKTFAEYNEVIDYLNEFYDYEKMEEHFIKHLILYNYWEE